MWHRAGHSETMWHRAGHSETMWHRAGYSRTMSHRFVGSLEVLGEAHTAADRDLVRRHLALEEVRELLHVLQLQKRKGVARPIHRRHPDLLEPSVGDVLEIGAH